MHVLQFDEMIAGKVILLFCILKIVIGYQHEKPIHATLTADRCSRNSYRLNDCNWCSCENTIYKCKARVCNEIDPFGHFNDAIQDINVGMEGHGAWRSKTTICEAGVMYERDDLICICTADGIWPNPICRDNFRVLHDVELISAKVGKHTSNTTCIPTKLYVVGCNTCFCPDTGIIDPEMCTKVKCDDNDPVLRIDTNFKEPEGLEIYAECNIDTHYKIGCKKCVCLRNNRLMCEACVEGNPISFKAEDETICSSKPSNKIFHIGCNICSCDDKGSLYCTTKKCLASEEKDTIEVSKTTENNLRSSNRPVVDMECVPGTSFKKDCNKCFCKLLENGKKTVGCTLKRCIKTDNILSEMKDDCVEGMVYKKHCLKCRCDLIDGNKRETCLTDPECSKKANTLNAVDSKLGSLDGYCQPHKSYAWDCNSCRCLHDGETVVCSNKICDYYDKDAVTVDIIPVRQNTGIKCPKDHMYKIGCNVCFCLDNGNALCTTKECGP